MKITAAIFLFFISFLVLQPVVGNQLFVKKVVKCERTCGMMAKCGKSKKKEKEDCNTCNPFMPCSIGNFFLLGKSIVVSSPVIYYPDKIIPVDEKVVSDYLAVCWHPPESLPI